MWTAVVVAKGMWDITQNFLDTLLETTDPGQIREIVYLDNGTPTGEHSWGSSAEWAKKNDSQTLLVTRMMGPFPPWNLSEAWNHGIHMSRWGNDKVLVCNNDISFHGPGWLNEFEAGLDEEGVGIVGTIGMSWKDTPFIQGSLLGFKRKTFDDVGGFDTQFEFTCEDVDFAKQVAGRGLGIKAFEKFRDSGTIRHLEGATRNYYKGDTKRYQYLAHLSRLRFCYKWTYPDISIHD